MDLVFIHHRLVAVDLKRLASIKDVLRRAADIDVFVLHAGELRQTFGDLALHLGDFVGELVRTKLDGKLHHVVLLEPPLDSLSCGRRLGGRGLGRLDFLRLLAVPSLHRAWRSLPSAPCVARAPRASARGCRGTPRRSRCASESPSRHRRSRAPRAAPSCASSARRSACSGRSRNSFGVELLHQRPVGDRVPGAHQIARARHLLALLGELGEMLDRLLDGLRKAQRTAISRYSSCAS